MDHHLGRHESPGGVTCVTTECCRKMRSRLARGLQSVVASGTLTEHLRRVPHQRRPEIVLVMAILAGLPWRRGYMRGRLGNRSLKTALHMATHAGPGHPFGRQTGFVTGIALQPRMCAFEYKPRRGVIETGNDLRDRLRTHSRQYGNGDQRRHGKTSV